MSTFIIQGGRPVGGRFRPSGNKNAALPMLAACLLTDEPVELRNIPLIEDVRAMLDILAHLGADITVQRHTVRICAAAIRTRTVPRELCARIRSSILFAGPLAARHGRAILFPPGGDVIGRRRLDTHVDGLGALGIRVQDGDRYTFRARALQAANILLDEASVTATENVLMAATLAPGTTTVFNAACEPHVQDLCQLLNRMGARISGIGTNRLRIRGVPRLHGARHRVRPDYIEAGSFLAAAALTGGALEVRGVDAADLQPVRRVFGRLGVTWASQGKLLQLSPGQPLRVASDFGDAVPKIEDGVWPAFPSDLMSVAIVLATQAEGTMLFFEKLFESRMYFVDRLIEMGARIVQCDPHRVMVMGPSPLRGGHVASPDIRAGMAVITAALVARGESRIGNAEIVDRGYEALDEKLRALGADIERVETRT